MQSIRALYNDELVEAHREAVAALRELLSEEKDPIERRKLANAILRARPAKEDAPSLAREAGEGGGGSATPGEGALSSAPSRHARAVHQDDVNLDHDDGLDHDDNYDDEDPNDPAHREIDALAHQLQHGPDPLAAITRLQAIMKGNMESLTPSTGASQNA